jgi:2-C-methyl-D-erythritol 4-phosphate cytidylyltransferase
MTLILVGPRGTISAMVNVIPDRLWALIPCAGSGSRSGAQGPKQYQLLAGQTMVLHTLAAFEAVAALAGILVVVAADDSVLDFPVLSGPWEAGHSRIQRKGVGGATRAASVCNGLQSLQLAGAADSDWVLVHDAARCLITPAQIEALIAACRSDPVGGLLALPLPDTLKQQSDASTRVAATLPRGDKWLAQTPQMFRLGALLQALRHTGDAVTDESSAIEAMGGQPLLVAGSAQNFKVTYPSDFALAEAVLRARAV